jgi:hypothetical protein
MRLVIISIELLWLLYFISLNIATYAVTTASFSDRAMRQDIFNLGTHGVVFVAAIHNGEKCAPWLVALYGYELFRDIMNGINISIYSQLATLQRELWYAAMVLVWYQTGGTFISLMVCLVKLLNGGGGGGTTIKVRMPTTK